mmetsp:Transcript_39962/g.83930  ORF Transcript_39962/g.83930 Transcript_39962/m.83930 type:complete len:289 (+) Transcript_39962:94-960(+)|eukprot:CAMPEP_0183723926 /NCGR_PEP_ID=MMETSP0737-20130205/16769_1 /TAXON_ID=385413 /ORGANISM="Thalassiosira miniscula, Strain CCMP1093" /LENGTH=288 /DNA_ID=CAMNT_0025954353 /DNA_START=79 /DNA_END=945 /DNA_ORIENTATION=+
MTAITTNASALPADEASDAQTPRRSIPPSASPGEAKGRFVSALANGVDALLDRGRGRERASAEILSEIADGCTPDEDEIFQTMETLGISLEDATKVMTVSSAFRKARTENGGCAAAAIDELTSRLNMADLSYRGESSRSPSPTSTTASTPNTLQLTRNESVDSFQTRPSAMAKKGQRPLRAKSQPQGRGRKRTLSEKTPENSNENVMVEKTKTTKAETAADLQVKEKMLHAKLSKAEAKKPKPSARAKSPEGLGARGKRTAAIHVEESQANKRPRTRSQTEESIPDCL